jgi:hypothetical protein
METHSLRLSRHGQKASHVPSSGLDAGASGKLVKVLKCPDIGILHHVFGFGIVAQDRAGDTVEPLVVPAHDDLVQSSIAGFLHARRSPGRSSLRSWRFRDFQSFPSLYKYRAGTVEKITSLRFSKPMRDKAPISSK